MNLWKVIDVTAKLFLRILSVSDKTLIQVQNNCFFIRDKGI